MQFTISSTVKTGDGGFAFTFIFTAFSIGNLEGGEGEGDDDDDDGDDDEKHNI